MHSPTVAIIQARTGSSRFPKKMLANLGEHPLLVWVLKRVSHSKKINDAILATSNLPQDEPLVELAKSNNIKVFRGDEKDVLGRFVATALSCGAKTVVRVCADNPFIDPEEIDRLITFYQKNPCDYACNHQARLNNHYADGFGAEILSTQLLIEIAKKATTLHHHEHVTSYLWEHQNDYKLLAVPSPKELSYPELCFDVDEPSDLKILENLVQSTNINLKSKASEIVQKRLSFKP